MSTCELPITSAVLPPPKTFSTPPVASVFWISILVLPLTADISPPPYTPPVVSVTFPSASNICPLTMVLPFIVRSVFVTCPKVVKSTSVIIVFALLSIALALFVSVPCTNVNSSVSVISPISNTPAFESIFGALSVLNPPILTGTFG